MKHIEQTTGLPIIHYYNQDFIDIYNKIWVQTEDFFHEPNEKAKINDRYFGSFETNTINQLESIFSTFFLIYSNKRYSFFQQLDNFYNHQREDGYIAGSYYIENGNPVVASKDGSDLNADIKGVSLPFFSWAEYNIYCKTADKRRLQTIAPKLLAYNKWIYKNMLDKDANLIKSYKISSGDDFSPRKDEGFFVDFNSAFAIDLTYLIKILEAINSKEQILELNKIFFLLKINMNQKMWDKEDGFYYDLDVNLNVVKIKCISNYSILLAKIPDLMTKDRFCEYLTSDNHFNSENPFCFLSKSEKCKDEISNAVFPFWTFIVIKGLEKSFNYEMAQTFAIKHLFSLVNTSFTADDELTGGFFYAYKSDEDKGIIRDRYPYNTDNYLFCIGLAIIVLFIENILGINVNLSKKMLVWNIVDMEEMGIENLSLKRNNLTILSSNQRGRWELKLVSEKLYYIHINEIKKDKIKQLPILSGKCSLILDKITDIVLTKMDSYI